MLESSTYRYILQQGIEQGIEQGALRQGIELGIEQGIEQGERKNAVKSILNVLDARFHVGAEQTLRLSLEGIEDLQRLEQLLRTAPRCR